VQIQYPIYRKLNWFIHRELKLIPCHELSSTLSAKPTDGS
jgi:hypothetical protein